MSSFRSECQPIADEIERVKKSIDSLQELLTQVSPSGKPGVIDLIQAEQEELRRLRDELVRCQNPPRPDLVATGFQIVERSDQNRTFKLRVSLVNIGEVAVSSDFRIAIRVAYFKGGLSKFSATVIQIPSSVTIAAEGGSYQTEDFSQHEMIYLDEDPSAFYTIEVKADVLNEIDEIRETNNGSEFSQIYFMSPRAPQTPFHIDSDGVLAPIGS